MEEMRSEKIQRGNTLITPLAYISHMNAKNVYVIDTGNDTLKSKVDTEYLSFGVAVNPDGTEIYVTNFFDDKVSVIDIGSNMVIKILPVGRSPTGIAVNPMVSLHKAYVTNSGGFFNPVDNTVSVIDTRSKVVTKTLIVGSGPSGVAFSPDGTRAYVANSYDNTVSVIDALSDRVIQQPINVGKNPKGLAISPDGTKVYVTNGGDNTTSAIDTTTNKVTATVTVGYSPFGVAVTPDGTEVYVANLQDDSVSIIDTESKKVIKTLPVGVHPKGVAVTPDGSKAYVAICGWLDWWEEKLSIIDTESKKVIKTLPVRSGPVAFGQFITPKLTANKFANFSYIELIGYTRSRVFFHDESAGNPISWLWDFGPRTFPRLSSSNIYSTEQNPSCYYYSEGTYTVTLTVRNAAGESSTVSKMLHVKPYKPFWQQKYER